MHSWLMFGRDTLETLDLSDGDRAMPLEIAAGPQSALLVISEVTRTNSFICIRNI